MISATSTTGSSTDISDGQPIQGTSGADTQPLPEEISRHLYGHLKAGNLTAANDADEASNNGLAPSDADLMKGLSESGIEIGEGELQLAAGAAYRGAPTETALLAYKRYVAALEGLKGNLNEDLHGVVDEGIKGLNSLIGLIERNQEAGQPERAAMGQEIVASLQPGQRVMVPAGIIGHAMVAEVGRFADGSYYIRIYNSGSGVSANHWADPNNPEKFATFAEYRFDSITADDFAKLLTMSDHYEGTRTVQDVYDWAAGLPGAIETPIEAGSYSFQSPQRSNDCALESINSYLKDLTIRGFSNNAENPVAKALYLEMQASYLNQLILDYNGQNGYTEGVENLLWAIRVRADRAELAAGNVMGDEAKTLFSQFKANARVYNQVADLVRDPHTVKDFPYNSSAIELTYDVGASVNGKVVFRGENGEVFIFDKETKALSISNPSLWGPLTTTMEPTFDEYQKLQSIRLRMSASGSVYLDNTLIRASCADLPGNEALRGALSDDELARLGAIKGDAYLKVVHPVGGATGEASVEGYIYTDDGKSLIRFEKSEPQGELVVGQPVELMRLSKGARYSQIGSEGSANNDLKLDFSVPETPVDGSTSESDDASTSSGEEPWMGMDSRTAQADIEGPNAVVAIDFMSDALRAQVPTIADAEFSELALDPQAGPVHFSNTESKIVDAGGKEQSIKKIRITQLQLDGSTRTLTRTEVSGAGVVWTRQDLSANGQSLHEVTHTVGSDGYSERTVVRQADGSLKETLVEKADSKVSLNDVDRAFVRTERITTEQEDGSTTVFEVVSRGDSLENVNPGGHPSQTAEKVMQTTHEVGADGVERTREVGTSRTLEGGRLTAVQTSTVTAHRAGGDVVESMESTVTTPSNVTVRSQTTAGQTSQEVWVDGRFVAAAEAPDRPDMRAALAVQDLARQSSMAQMAEVYGVDYLAPLLGEQGLSQDPLERRAQLEGLLEAGATGSMSRAYACGAFMSGGAALALYSGITGIFALNRAIKAGSVYGVGAAATGVAAAGAQIAEVGLQGATLVSSSARALNALTRAAGVAGKLSVGLGLVAMGVAVPGLIDAIHRGDTKAIVSSAVSLGGGLAALAAGAAFGGPLGMAIGLGIGIGVVAFTELWNWLYHPGTPLKGPDPLSRLSLADRALALQHAQTLFGHWGELGGDLSAERLKQLSEKAPSEDIKAAAKFYVDHAELIPWMDGANGGDGDLDKRQASFDGRISQGDLARFIGYIAVPSEIYETLPAPSQDARLWVAGILDPDTHQKVVDAFGKDGRGQGSGDGIAALPEYANIASGLFDDRTRALLKKAHPHESDAQIEKRLSQLKQACAYLAAYPSELRWLDTIQWPDHEDGKVSAKDMAVVRQAHQARIDELLQKYPDAMPSFNEEAQAHSELGSNNPALWRPGRFNQFNPYRPQSTFQVAYDNFSAIDSNADQQIDWIEMAQAREEALQQSDYSLYFSIDELMRNGGDVFEDRGEGMALKLGRADLALKAGQDRISVADAQKIPSPSATDRATQAAVLLDFIQAHPSGQASLPVDDLRRLSAGYWAASDASRVPVDEATRLAARYFTQYPEELALVIVPLADGQSPPTEIDLARLLALVGQRDSSTPVTPEKPNDEQGAVLERPGGVPEETEAIAVE